MILILYIILVKEQCGFRINSPNMTVSYNVITEISKAINNRLCTGGTFCDLEKTFDCVNHGI
jgi:hypothetical protein